MMCGPAIEQAVAISEGAVSATSSTAIGPVRGEKNKKAIKDFIHTYFGSQNVRLMGTTVTVADVDGAPK